MTGDDATPVAGTLVLVAGPSGAGKDTLLAGARASLAHDQGFVFVRRTITRAPDAGGEAHDAMTPEAFADAEAAGAFALSWRAHGLAYGLPAAIGDDLAAGRVVVANVSRTVADEARARWPRVLAVLVTASPDILARRLAERGREGGQALRDRLARAAEGEAVFAPDVRILNDGVPEDGIAALVEALRAVRS
ncbi:phosphonate metabolism protein/1,5-bisphosphokinase (PRPP-forming) PhnN [Futiania mangrovi]|uniref:Ribose 1,5-bisphosphate phosphokinase PhnN n=1 Tax=Futiania mangrovi TaxID=2959716 RepID=A0A9J6PGR5_9PROT|nr:phosphonate metabolism protein/1,5-bisphosphokinase (PRPP-forming) PhnN [Futiania mangrovii]MCP1337678.1 phosphonate metabolism protein/1,5-bisphosphokinase (PRPP-forming) PhnN [Futiania mangrovii]